MPGRAQLAAEKPEGLLKHTTPLIEGFVRQALTGAAPAWRALGDPVDVDRLFSILEHHRVQTLLYHAARQSPDWTDWPGSVRERLQCAVRAAVAQDALRAHVLTGILAELGNRDIPCLLIKGEALARTLYRQPGSRVRADSDILVPVTAAMALRDTLRDLGYVAISPALKSHQFVVRRSSAADHTLEIDAHWRVLNAARFARVLEFEELQGRSIPVPGIAGGRAPAHCHSLLLACMHRWGSESHDRNRLIWLYDIHLLASELGTDELAAFAEDAVRRDVQDCCLEGIERAREAFGTAVPQSVLSLLGRPRRRAGLGDRLARSNLGLLLDDWRRLPDRRSRMALLGELFFPPFSELEHKYDRSGKLWAPVLYARHIVGGLAARLTFR